jgi:hypothetical protein
MSPRRLAFVLIAALAAAPALSRAAIPVGMYPIRAPGISAADRKDLHAVLEAALASAARRGILQPRTPVLQLASCGDRPTPACLGAAARDGVILAGHGETANGVLFVTVALYDRTGARTREVRFPVDLVIQNMRPVGMALAGLELEIEPDGTVAGGVPAPQEPGVAANKPAAAARPGATATAIPTPIPILIPTPPPTGNGARTAPPTAATPRPAAAPPAPLSAPKPPPERAAAASAQPRTPVDVSAPRAVWKRQAGPLFTILGAGLLAGGGAVAYLNQKLAHDLDAKHAAGTLTASDRASYDKVDRYNVLSAALLSAGGVSVAAGTWIWITAPGSGSGAVALAGGTF